MLRVAQENGASVSNVTFRLMAAERLEFPDASFDTVLCRHAPVFVAELHRVTKPDGLFLYQGVGANNMANFRDAFAMGSGPQSEEYDQQLVAALRSREWRIIATGSYDVRYWVKDLPSLLFWLNAIAGANPVPADFSIHRHHQVINQLVSRSITAKGFATNEHRTLLIASKSS